MVNNVIRKDAQNSTTYFNNLFQHYQMSASNLFYRSVYTYRGRRASYSLFPCTRRQNIELKTHLFNLASKKA